jgi:hypothetical protein
MRFRHADGLQEKVGVDGLLNASNASGRVFGISTRNGGREDFAADESEWTSELPARKGLSGSFSRSKQNIARFAPLLLRDGQGKKEYKVDHFPSHGNSPFAGSSSPVILFA